MRVHVKEERLSTLRFQAGCDRAVQRVGRRGPRRRTARGRRSPSVWARLESGHHSGGEHDRQHETHCEAARDEHASDGTTSLRLTRARARRTGSCRDGTPILEAHALTKRYGPHRGVEDLTFRVEPGEIFGFLGPNGAGKTTTIRLVVDLIRPTGGSVVVFGSEPRSSPSLRGRIGYLPGDLRLYERLTGRELLGYFGHLRGPKTLALAEALAERLGVELDRPVKMLSKGNRQKIGIVQAFMHAPELLVLDEPTSGLDPLVQQTFYELLQEARADGRTVFLSSHVLPEVQHVADRVALLREGKLVLSDTVEALRAHSFIRVEVKLEAPPDDGAFASLPGVRVLERRGSGVSLAVQGEIDPLIKLLAGFHVLSLDSREADLEDIFLAIYRADRDGAWRSAQDAPRQPDRARLVEHRVDGDRLDDGRRLPRRRGGMDSPSPCRRPPQ
jgi:ABC-2 type transport system ATP-binding protein